MLKRRGKHNNLPKKQEAEKLGVKLNAEIDESYPIMADDYDICRILFNIADNSVAAAAKLEKNRTADIKIEVTQDEIIFESKNGKPRDHENKPQNKADEHGYGIKIIGEIAQNTAANTSIKSKTEFTTQKQRLRTKRRTSTIHKKAIARQIISIQKPKANECFGLLYCQTHKRSPRLQKALKEHNIGIFRQIVLKLHICRIKFF